MKQGGRKIILIILGVLLAAALLVGVVLYFAIFLPQQRKQENWARQVQAYRDAKMEQFRQENQRYGDYEVDVAFLGDSLTDGYDLSIYYPQFITANRGIGGDTTFDLEDRLEVSVYELKPKVAVMLIGANNPDTMFENYENILIGLKENLPDTQIVLLSMTAMGGEHWGSKNELAAYNNVTIKLLAQKYGYTFIDLYTPLYDLSIREVYEGYTSDGGHLTHQGYTVVTEQITPVLEKLLEKPLDSDLTS
jgi:lysophospholipase L1-like esterase